MLTFRRPKYDREQTSDHVLVATAEFLINFPTHQICFSCTDSDIAILQRETETIRDSKFQLLHNSQPVAFGLLVALLTNGAELPAIVTVPLMSLKLHRCFKEQTSSLVFQCVACDTVHFVQSYNLMRRPGLLCLIFESTHFFRMSARDNSVACAAAA